MNRTTVKDLVDARHPYDVPVRKIPQMRGRKKAVWDGCCLYISPAMASLLADPNEVEAMSAAIQIQIIPRFDPLSAVLEPTER